MHILIIVILLAGCSFKGNEDPSTQSSESKVFGKTITISWDGENSASIKRAIQGSKNYFLNEPVTIPEVAPDKVTISFNSPLFGGGKIIQEPKIFISNITEGSGQTNPLRLRGTMGDTDLEIFGLRTFFAVDKQQKGLLKVAFQNAVTGEQEATLAITVMTPPTSSEFKIGERGSVIENRLLKFQANEVRLDLIKTLTIRNTSNQRQEYILPNTLAGVLRKDFRRFNIREHACHTENWQDAWSEDYPTVFYLLPIGSDLEEDWVLRISEDERSFYLDSDEEIMLGVYGAGKSLADFVDYGVPVSRSTNTRAVSYCYNPCEHLFLQIRDPDFPPREPRCRDRQEKHYKDFPIGLDTAGVRWILDSNETLAKIRNGFLPRDNDPMFRSVQFLGTELGIL